jgi:hypothetical protein
MRKAAFVYIILTCTLFSCIKPPNYPNAPQITFVSVSSPIATNGFSDTITFSYTCGDGLIGTPATDIADTVSGCTDNCGIQHGDSTCLKQQAFNVFLIDSRDSCITSFATANVPVGGKYKGISGTVQIITVMSNLKCYLGCPCAVADTVNYAIIFKDMLGNRSNTIHTGPIAIAACN